MIRVEQLSSCAKRKRISDISAYFGRSISIDGDKNMQLPEAIDDEHLSGALGQWNTQPDGTPSWMDAFIQRLELIRIVGEIPIDESTPSPLPSELTALDHQVILKKDTMIANWHSALPAHLKVSLVNDGGQRHDATMNGGHIWRTLSAKRLHTR